MHCVQKTHPIGLKNAIIGLLSKESYNKKNPQMRVFLYKEMKDYFSPLSILAFNSAKASISPKVDFSD